MIKYFEGSIFDAPVNIIIHQSNVYQKMGAGIAKQIKEKYPEAYEADLKTYYADNDKIGTYSYAVSNKDGKIIINMYSQLGIGDSVETSYDAMYKALSLICSKNSKNKTIGIPYGMGCGLARGNWIIVEAVIKAVFEKTDFDVLICKLNKR